MLKKFTLGIVLATALITSVSAGQHILGGKFSEQKYRYTIKVDQSSRDALLHTFYCALMLDDIEVFWQILDPEVVRKMEQEKGGSGKAKAEFQKAMRGISAAMINFDQEMDVKLLMIGLIEKNPDMVWNSLTATDRNALIRRAGSEKEAKEQYFRGMMNVRNQIMQQFQQLIYGKHSKKINGKWYFTLS